MNALQKFRGFTVDERLREFRRVTFDKDGNPGMETISFNNKEGRAMFHAVSVALLYGEFDAEQF